MDLNLTLKSLVNETIAPLLKTLGFKKSGYNFYREAEEIGVSINLQQSKWNSAEAKQFTINVGLVHKEIFRTMCSKELTKFPKEYDCLISTRLSHLKHEKDNWYELNVNTDFSSIANQFNNDILDYLIPFIKKYEQFQNWIDFTTLENSKFVISDTTKFYILIKFNKLHEANHLLKELHKKSITPQRSSSTITYPDGTSITTESEPYVNWSYVNNLKDIAKKFDINLE